MIRPDISNLPPDVQANVLFLELVAAGSTLAVQSTLDAREEARKRPRVDDLPLPLPRRLQRSHAA